jgi:dTMP kinase
MLGVPMLIAFDGPEGAGKSTQAGLLAKKLGALKIREPGGTILGEQLRALLLNPESKICVHAEVMMFMASRAQMYLEKILPALKAGQTIVMDRWAWSTYAYQQSLKMKEFKYLVDFATGGVYPDVTFILDVSPKVGIERLAKKVEQSFGGSKDRFEQRDVQYHLKVQERYLELAAEFKLHALAGEQSVEDTHAKVLRLLK